MKFIFEKTHNKMVTIAVTFDAGARAEGDKYTPGMAHMLEHMMFKGTTKRSCLDISKEVAFLGGSINAYTSPELVCYYIRVPYDNFEAGMEILADMTLNSTFPEEEFVKEKEVVLEECLSYKDDPLHDFYNSFFENFYHGRMKIPVIGTEESIKSFTREELLEFYQEFYRSENAILTIAGDIDPEHMKATSEKLFGPETEFVKSNLPEEHEYAESRVEIVTGSEMEQCHVLIAWPSDHYKDGDDKYTLTILKEILGSGMDSRLFIELREKNNLCYDIHMDSHSHLDFGEITISSSTREENVEKMLNLVEAEIEKIKTELVTEEEIQRAKNKTKSQIYSIYDNGNSIVNHRMMMEFFKSKSLEEISVRLDQVTREDILNLAKKVFTDDHKMIFILMKDQQEEVLEKPSLWTKIKALFNRYF